MKKRQWVRSLRAMAFVWSMLGGVGVAMADDAENVAALRERVAVLETLFFRVGPVVVVAFGVFGWRTHKKAQEKGPDQALAEQLLARDDVRLTKMFDGMKADLVKRMLARDRAIVLLGDQDKDRVVTALSRMGFFKFVDTIDDADVAIFLGLDSCRSEHPNVGRVLAQKARMVPVVLYTGSKRLGENENIIERLNEISVAIPANTPTTAAQHAATLLMLTQK